jgi:hypothetical protein
MELVCALISTLLIGETTPVARKRTAKSFCSTATVLTVTGGIGAAAPDAPLAGAAGADAPALAGAARASFPAVLAPAGEASLFPQAANKITERLAASHQVVRGRGIERMIFIVVRFGKGLS